MHRPVLVHGQVVVDDCYRGHWGCSAKWDHAMQWSPTFFYLGSIQRLTILPWAGDGIQRRHVRVLTLGQHWKPPLNCHKSTHALWFFECSEQWHAVSPAFLYFYADEKVQQYLDDTIRNVRIYMDISKQMAHNSLSAGDWIYSKGHYTLGTRRHEYTNDSPAKLFYTKQAWRE